MLAYFGIESSGVNLVINLLIVFVVVAWLALIWWTYADAQRRIADPMLIGCAVAASLFPFVGTMVYAILRPPEYLEDVHERDVELRAAEVRLAQLEHSLCPHCDAPTERDFLICPNCLNRLKERCSSCARPLEPDWTVCPYCETEVPGAIAARRAGRRDAGSAPLESSADSAFEAALQESPAERREARMRARARRRSGVTFSQADEDPLDIDGGAPAGS
jgi:RNA polymerase subunit RPABC4/transcription elongation factor Spt4